MSIIFFSSSGKYLCSNKSLHQFYCIFTCSIGKYAGFFFYKIDSAFFLSGQSINSGLLMFGSQAWGSVCHFTSVLHGFKSSWHIVLFIYHPGCRNKKTIWSFRGLVSVGDMDFITPKLEKKVYSYGWVPGFSNYGFRTNAQHPLFQILMRPLSLTARVHKPADFEI